jgi:hypothetical protein
MIKFENVTFCKDVIRKMKKEEFISSHLNIFWRDKDEQTRKKMLSQVYGLCAEPKKAK